MDSAITQTGLEQLAQFVVSTDMGKISDEDLNHMKLDILDSIGCGLYGSRTPWAQSVTRFVTKWGEEEHSTIWGTGSRTSCRNATLANGTATQAVELDNSHNPLGLHLGCSVFAATLAVAEKEHVSGEDLLTAVTAGYEVTIRIRDAMDFSHVKKGFNSTGTCSGFGTAAAVGKLIGLDKEQIADAMGIVGVNSVGIQASQFSMAKRIMGPRTAEGGILAAYLAAEGFSGTHNLLEAELGGFFGSFSDHYDLQKLTAKLGQEMKINGMSIKPYPSSHGTHAALDAAQWLREEYAIDPNSIKSVRVFLPPPAAKTKIGWRVTDIPSALHDVPFTVALMLQEGDFFVDQLTPEKLRDPNIRRLMDAVEIIAEPAFGEGLDKRWTGQVEIELMNGKVLKSDVIYHPKGCPENPLNKDEVVQKFRKLACTVVGDAASSEIIRNVDSLEEIQDINTLTQWFVPSVAP